MKIQVLENYGGWATQEQRILPGVYDADAPELYGVGMYLVEVGKAVIVEDEPPPVPKPDTEVKPKPKASKKGG